MFGAMKTPAQLAVPSTDKSWDIRTGLQEPTPVASVDSINSLFDEGIEDDKDNANLLLCCKTTTSMSPQFVS